MLKNLTTRLLSLTGFMAFATACGGGIDINQVREDFNNPSGTTSDKNAVMAVEGHRNGSSPALGLAAGGIPGFGLSVQGEQTALRQLSLAHWQPQAQYFYRSLKDLRAGRSVQSLSEAQWAGDGCDDSPEAQAAAEELQRELFTDALLGGGSASASADYNIDVSACSGGALSGSASVKIEMEFTENSFRFTVEQSLDVCETAGDGACVDGDLVMEASANSAGDDLGDLEFISGWELNGSWTENGVNRTATLKGGVRIAASNTGTSEFGSVEYLFYVKTPDGEEYSYVLGISAQSTGGTGSAQLSIRGRDGELTCTVNSDGSGMCSGVFNHMWTAEEYNGLSNEWYEG